MARITDIRFLLWAQINKPKVCMHYFWGRSSKKLSYYLPWKKLYLRRQDVNWGSLSFGFKILDRILASPTSEIKKIFEKVGSRNHFVSQSKGTSVLECFCSSMQVHDLVKLFCYPSILVYFQQTYLLYYIYIRMQYCQVVDISPKFKSAYKSFMYMENSS